MVNFIIGMFVGTFAGFTVAALINIAADDK